MKPPASLTALATELKSLNAGPAHQDRVLRAWLRGHPLDHGPRKQAAENFLPLALRTALPQLQAALDALATVVSEHPGSDGRRLLVRVPRRCVLLWRRRVLLWRRRVLLWRCGLCVWIGH